MLTRPWQMKKVGLRLPACERSELLGAVAWA
jgi:hypothetical protein